MRGCTCPVEPCPAHAPLWSIGARRVGEQTVMFGGAPCTRLRLSTWMHAHGYNRECIDRFAWGAKPVDATPLPYDQMAALLGDYWNARAECRAYASDWWQPEPMLFAHATAPSVGLERGLAS